jgi:hypothetical protein
MFFYILTFPLRYAGKVESGVMRFNRPARYLSIILALRESNWSMLRFSQADLTDEHVILPLSFHHEGKFEACHAFNGRLLCFHYPSVTLPLSFRYAGQMCVNKCAKIHDRVTRLSGYFYISIYIIYIYAAWSCGAVFAHVKHRKTLSDKGPSIIRHTQTKNRELSIRHLEAILVLNAMKHWPGQALQGLELGKWLTNHISLRAGGMRS